MESLMDTRGAWRGITAAALLAAVLLAYYWPHKPLDARVITALGGAALDLLAVSLIVAVAGGVGRRVLCVALTPPTLAAASPSLGRPLPHGEREESRAERIALEGM